MKKNIVQFEYCSINEMIIDDFIKSLNKFEFQKFVNIIELIIS